MNKNNSSNNKSIHTQWKRAGGCIASQYNYGHLNSTRVHRVHVCAVCTVYFSSLQFMLVSRACSIKCTLYAIKRLARAHTKICCSTQILPAYAGNQTLNPTKMKFIELLQCRSAYCTHTNKQTNQHTMLHNKMALSS